MSNINVIIGESSFEAVRNQIAQILAVEFANQKTLINDKITAEGTSTELQFALDCIPPKVWLERFTRPTPGESDKIWVNVMFAKRNKTLVDSVSHQQCNAMFAIECWSRSKGTAEHRADTMASLRLTRVLGVCSQILKAKCYRELGLEGEIGTLSVSDIEVSQPEYGSESSDAIIEGTLFVYAQVNDNSLECSYEGVLADGVDTTMYVNSTEEGIYWKTNLE